MFVSQSKFVLELVAFTIIKISVPPPILYYWGTLMGYYGMGPKHFLVRRTGRTFYTFQTRFYVPKDLQIQIVPFLRIGACSQQNSPCQVLGFLQ